LHVLPKPVCDLSETHLSQYDSFREWSWFVEFSEHPNYLERNESKI